MSCVNSVWGNTTNAGSVGRGKLASRKWTPEEHAAARELGYSRACDRDIAATGHEDATEEESIDCASQTFDDC